MTPELRRRVLPIGLGLSLIAVGLGIGFFTTREESPEPPLVPTSPVPTELPEELAPEPEPEPEPEAYVPDLSGPEVGELLVAGAADAHGLSARDGRLVWITTERATVGSARYDGGDAVVLFSEKSPDRFGGAFARSQRGLYFSVAGDDPEPIYFVPAAQLEKPPAGLEPVAHGSAPDHFVISGETLVWADLGVLRRLDGEPKELARRTGRIAGLAADPSTLFFLEVPPGDLSADLFSLPLGGGEPRRLAALDRAERDTLLAEDGTLVWSETRGESHRILRKAPDGEPEILAPTGLVAALAIAEGRVYWSERHGDDEAVSLLRSAPLRSAPLRTPPGEDDRAADAGEPTRHGRREGGITALAVADGHLFFSGSGGLYRLPLAQPR